VLRSPREPKVPSGGSWYDINGWLTWALGSLDGEFPVARQLAWSEYLHNTLASHANAYPDSWDGTISSDDVCNGYYSPYPQLCGNSLSTQFGGQNTEQPTWMVMDAIRLAGITPTGAGFLITPHLPLTRFSLRLPDIGVAVSPGLVRGYVRVQQSGPLTMTVAVPRGEARRRQLHQEQTSSAGGTGPGRGPSWARSRSASPQLRSQRCQNHKLARSRAPGMLWAVTSAIATDACAGDAVPNSVPAIGLGLPL
jgi:hypothetical protein